MVDDARAMCTARVIWTHGANRQMGRMMDLLERGIVVQDLEEGNAYFSADIDDPLEQAGRGHSVLSRVESVPGPVDDDEIFWLDGGPRFHVQASHIITH